MIRIGLCLIAAILAMPTPAQAEGAAGCQENVSITAAQIECVADADKVRDLYANAQSAGYRYRLEKRCKPGQQCGRDERICRSSGRPGTWYVLIRTTIATGETTSLSIVCLTPGDEASLVVITPAMVRREMQRLEWPKAELDIQPPDGQTLINFDTNFFTSNTEATTQTVVLLGQQVTIEATPNEYTWHFGDGAATTTTTPGAAYPALDVTHRYAEPGQVRPSVDTTYTGRYRVNGDAWQDIPGSLTVAGESVQLRVRSAQPHLVGSPA